MRVCLFTPYDLSHEGGVNRHVRSLADALQRRGHEVLVLGPASGPVPEGCLGISGAIPVPANGSVARIGLLASARATRARLAAGAWDVVHVHEPLVPGPGRHAVRFSPVPVVATFHASAEREIPLQRFLRRFASARLTRIARGIAVSRQAKRFARAIYRGRISIIPNGVDLARFAGPAAPRPASAPAAPLAILFVGRFAEPRKGFAVLLEAAALLARAGRPVHVSVVGDGPGARFREKAGALPVTFLGRLPDAELAERYRASDVFCAPSLGGESFGMVIAEAFASGCPAVASAIPGYAEAARGAALLVAPGDPRALADALWRAGTDPEIRARLVALGRARAEALAWSRIAARVEGVYRAAADVQHYAYAPSAQPA